MHLADRLLYRLFFRDIVGPWQWPRGSGDPADWQRIRFEGQAGKPLIGLLGEAHGQAKGVIVGAHPIRSDAKGYFLRSGIAAFLREAGYHVLLFDFNGFGESPRSAFRYPLDVQAAARAAQQIAPGLPLGLHGACFGAAVGLHLLPREDNPFRAVIVEGAPQSWLSYYSTVPGVQRSLRKQYLRLRAHALLAVGSLLHPAWRDQLKPLDHLLAARHVNGVLFLYGAEDPLIPGHVGEQIYETCRNAWQGQADAPETSLWLAPGTRHLAYYAADPEGYRERVVSFWDRTLAQASLPARACV